MSTNTLYSISCVTEGVDIETLLPGAANQCPNDSSHTVTGVNVQSGLTTSTSNYEVFESLAFTTFSGSVPVDEFDPTDPNFADKINVTTVEKPPGDYRIVWSYGWNHNSPQNDFIGRIVLDSTSVPMVHRQEPKDAGGTGPGGTNQRYYQSGFFQTTFASAGTHTIVLQLGTSDAAVDSSMFDARVEIYRVS